MIFLIHKSRRACLTEECVASRIYPNWYLAALGRPCILPLTVVGQVLCSIEGAQTCAMLAAVWPTHLSAGLGHTDQHWPDTRKLFLTPQALFRRSVVIQFQLCVVFYAFIFKLIKGYCKNSVLLTAIEVQTEMAIFMSCDSRPNACNSTCVGNYTADLTLWFKYKEKSQQP